MARTLLVGNDRVSTRDWLRANLRGRAFICLDPAEQVQGVPGRLVLYLDARPVWTRFVGSLEFSRAPHILVAALASVAARVPDDLVVQSFDYRPSPLARQTLLLVSQILQPDEIFIAEGTEVDQSIFPIGPTEVVLESALPSIAKDAQRKALWMKLEERCHPHEVDLRTTFLDGTRLGSGHVLANGPRSELNLSETDHCEVCGRTLLAVVEQYWDESKISKALDITGTSRAVIAHPNDYNGLVCALARASGEEFGYGFVESVDWRSRRMKIRADAIPPVPIAQIRLGTLRVDSKGRELSERRAWQV